jgi:tetratricopeptide (TPR) repeat protein
MKSFRLDKEKVKSLMRDKEYGPTLDNLLEIPESKIKQLSIYGKSNFFLVKGILWELLGHFPNAINSYLLSLKNNPKNQVTIQYLAQIYFKVGNIPKSRLFFKRFFSLNLKPISPFSSNRSFIGFRDRTEDIKYIKRFNIKSI